MFDNMTDILNGVAQAFLTGYFGGLSVVGPMFFCGMFIAAMVALFTYAYIRSLNGLVDTKSAAGPIKRLIGDTLSDFADNMIRLLNIGAVGGCISCLVIFTVMVARSGAPHWAQLFAVCAFGGMFIIGATVIDLLYTWGDAMIRVGRERLDRIVVKPVRNVPRGIRYLAILFTLAAFVFALPVPLCIFSLLDNGSTRLLSSVVWYAGSAWICFIFRFALLETFTRKQKAALPIG